MTDVAFLGSGTMGLPMARNLVQAGFTLHAWNRTPDRPRPLADEGAELFDDPRAAADGCSVMITMLSDADSVFEAVGARTLWVGEAGTGTAAKVAINSWVVGIVGGLAETLRLCEGLSVDPQVFFDAIEGGPLDLPYARLKGPAMMKRAFDDVSFRLALARKDADLVLAAAAEVGLQLPIMEGVAERLRAAEADGHGDEDIAAVFGAHPSTNVQQAR